MVDRLVNISAPLGDAKSDFSDMPTTLTDAVFGGPSDLWGKTYTPSDINSSNFAVIYDPLRLTGTPVCSVDSIKVKVYYSL